MSNQKLRRINFGPNNTHHVKAFSCGDASYCEFLNWWITAGKNEEGCALHQLEHGQSSLRVWLYFDRSKPPRLVGYGSIVNMRYGFLPGMEYRGPAIELPALAVHRDFKGEKFNEKSFASHIMEDLYAEGARRVLADEVDPLVVLWVDPANDEAIPFYKYRHLFKKLDGEIYVDPHDGIAYEAWHRDLELPPPTPPQA
jgi:hypothetical protein